MKVDKANLIYFSPAGNTKKIMESIAGGINAVSIEKYDILQGQDNEINFVDNELTAFGVPVYSGRVPSIVVEALNKFRGKQTPAVVVVVYGNREYDDALLELKNIVENNGFKVISGGAFVAEHSIFPLVANGRPDKQDKGKAVEFGKAIVALYEKCENLASLSGITVKGNNPYKEAKSIPLKPTGNRRCNQCGICVKACPAQAISLEQPRKTDKTRCISCAHCIQVCPQKARRFGGLLYKIAGRKFISAYATTRKEPELFYFSN